MSSTQHDLIMQPMQRGCGSSKPAVSVAPPVGRTAVLAPVDGHTFPKAAAGAGLSATDVVDPSDRPRAKSPRSNDVPPDVKKAWRKQRPIGDRKPNVAVKEVLRLFLHQSNFVGLLVLGDPSLLPEKEKRVRESAVSQLITAGVIRPTPLSPGNWLYTEDLFDKRSVEQVVNDIAAVLQTPPDLHATMARIALGVRLGEGSWRSILQPLFLRFLLMVLDGVLPAATSDSIAIAFAYDDAVTAYVASPATAPLPSSCLPARHAWGLMHVPAFVGHTMYALIRTSTEDSGLIDIVLINAGYGCGGDEARGISGHGSTVQLHHGIPVPYVFPVYGWFTADEFNEYVRKIRVVQPSGREGDAAAMEAVYTGFSRLPPLPSRRPVRHFPMREQIVGNCVFCNLWEALLRGFPGVDDCSGFILRQLTDKYCDILKKYLTSPYVHGLVDMVATEATFSPVPQASYLY